MTQGLVFATLHFIAQNAVSNIHLQSRVKNSWLAI